MSDTAVIKDPSATANKPKDKVPPVLSAVALSETDPAFKSREITASIGELQKTNWELMDMKDVLQTNIKDEGVELGVLTPAGQDLIFCVIDRVLSRQLEMLDHLKETLEIEEIDWEDLHVGSLDPRFDMVSWKNKDQ